MQGIKDFGGEREQLEGRSEDGGAEDAWGYRTLSNGRPQ